MLKNKFLDNFSIINYIFIIKILRSSSNSYNNNNNIEFILIKHHLIAYQILYIRYINNLYCIKDLTFRLTILLIKNRQSDFL